MRRKVEYSDNNEIQIVEKVSEIGLSEEQKQELLKGWGKKRQAVLQEYQTNANGRTFLEIAVENLMKVEIQTDKVGRISLGEVIAIQTVLNTKDITDLAKINKMLKESNAKSKSNVVDSKYVLSNMAKNLGR